MSSDRFGGSIHLTPSGMQPGRDPFKAELDTVMSAYKEYGFNVTDDLSGVAVLLGVGGAFAPQELGPTQVMPHAGSNTKNYFEKEVRPTLARAAEAGDQKALTIAFNVGRLISAAQIKGLANLTSGKQFSITSEQILADGLRQPYDIQTGWVIDYGMGINGLVMHLDNIRHDRYSLLGVQKSKGEQALLSGMAKHRGLAEEQVQIFAGGIQKNTEGLIKSSGPHLLDMIVASRVHPAGNDLKAGLRLSSQLLRSGGIVVARGPRQYREGLDYDKVHGILNADPKMDIINTRTFVSQSENGRQEANRVILARAR